jgi:hypothetical protein
LIDICRTLGCDTYLAGAGGAAYMNLKLFDDAGIKVIFQAFDLPPYPQRFGDFVADLSIVDFLFNCGGGSFDKIAETRSATMRP